MASLVYLKYSVEILVRSCSGKLYAAVRLLSPLKNKGY